MMRPTPKNRCYGIFARKDQVTADPNARMTNLIEEEQAARKDILDHFAHIKARGFKLKEALDQLVREIAFTHLNRLCAYKMMEAREVFIGGQKFREAVSRGVNSNGVKFYLAEHPEEERLFNTGHQDVAYQHFLDWLGGLLSDGIGVLFNPNDPANRLYPRQKALDEVLNLLNSGGIKPDEAELREVWPKIWSQDETIGWVYQYFTPKELRDQARKESQAPRNSYELAFRNQFFTPRYVVEFLTDNTLGRIWHEMRKGDTKLKDQCRYMVRRPTEIFLKEGEQPPKDAAEGCDDLSQEELLKLPVHIPHRPKKDPRELKILDPACGSGHFLLYCFDLLLTIYEEAYADPDLGPVLQKDYPKLEDLRRDVPGLILAHNLHGIDIDLRASQIAALALWLRCQRAYQEMELKKERPKITRSNVVCAEPMPGEERMLKDFVGQLEPKLLGQLVEVVFDKMKLAGEAGSLLNIEEEIQGAVIEARRQFDMGGLPIQQALFDESIQPGGKRFSVKELTDEAFFKQAETKVKDALHLYAEKSETKHNLQRRLFSEDAVRGFGFIDMCHKRFDVVLMNPPFGLPTLPVFQNLEKHSPDTYVEIYASLVSRSLKLAPKGFLGAITSRSFLTMSRLATWRRKEILNSAAIILDLGKGVMDEAQVESCAFVLASIPLQAPLLALDARSAADRKTASLSENWKFTDASCSLFCVSRNVLRELPGSKILYQLPKSFLNAISSTETFDPIAGEVRTGLTTFDDFRFLRLAWEVSISSLGRGVRWEFFSKGGEYAKYVTDVHLVVNRYNDGQELAEANIACNGQTAQSRQGSKYYYRTGLTFTSRSQRGFSVRVLPQDCVISHNAPSIYAAGDTPLEYIIGWANSRLIRSLVEIQGNFSYFTPGSIKNLPWRKPVVADQLAITSAANRLIQLYIEPLIVDETNRYFSHISVYNSLKETIHQVNQAHDERIRSIHCAQRDVSDAVDATYGVSSREFAIDVIEYDPDDDVPLSIPSPEEQIASIVSFWFGVIMGRWDIAYLVNGPPPIRQLDAFNSLPLCPPAMLKGEDGLPAEHIPNSYPLSISLDGIIVDDPNHPNDIIRQVREAIEIVWKNQGEAIEKEACEILGVRELRDYFLKPGKGGFWDDHVSRYSKSRRKAPIYWLLQSSKKNYAIWLYYHRLDKDLFFKALVNYVEPKLRVEISRIETLRSQKAVAGESGKKAKLLAKEIERQEDFISELRDFEDKLRRAANLHLEPDLNDGVVLNIAPLYDLVPWNEAKKYWDELLAGKHEWSSIGKQLHQKGLVKC